MALDLLAAANHVIFPWLTQVAVSQLLAAEDPAPVVDNPGAEAVAGRLHGNGKGNLPVGEPAQRRRLWFVWAVRGNVHAAI